MRSKTNAPEFNHYTPRWSLIETDNTPMIKYIQPQENTARKIQKAKAKMKMKVCPQMIRALENWS
jgi:hypothetical protein